MAASANSKDYEVPPLWLLLDVILDAYAIALNCDPQVTNLAVMAAFALGGRLGLSDHVLYCLMQSAAAETRHCRGLESLHSASGVCSHTHISAGDEPWRKKLAGETGAEPLQGEADWLHQRITHLRALRRMVSDARAMEAIDSIIAEAEARLIQLKRV
jgi:hypothetical protein